jgi:CBS domain-containing protein
MMYESVASLLMRKKSAKVVSIAPTATVAAAVRTMMEEGVGSIVVLDQLALVGILTERDVLVRVVGGARDPQTTRVSEVMTRRVHCVWPGTSVYEALRLMSERRQRHLPVLENGLVCGVLSSGDVTHWVIQWQRDQFDLAIGAFKEMGYSNHRGHHA